LERDMEDSDEELLLDSSQEGTQPSFRRRVWGVAGSILAMCAVVGLWHTQANLVQVKSDKLVQLVTKEEIVADRDCEDLPFINITKVISSNLGKQGPDKDEPEGIIYEAHAINTGADTHKLQIHVHSLKNFDVEESNTSYDASYTPAFKTGKFVNGVEGKFAIINIQQNTSLKLRLHAYDADAKEDVELPHGAISFFDLDTGKDNNHSVEHVKIDHFAAYYLSNETEITDSREGDFATFRATKEGTGADNPSNPMQLTKLQKDRAVTIEFENVKFFNFEIGASAGATGRLFSFVLRPSMLCARTKVHKHFYPPTGENAVIVPVETDNDKKSSAFRGAPLFHCAFLLVAMLAY